MDKEKMGKFIADTRRGKNMTQQQLADRLHVTDKAVSKWERGLSYPDLTLLEDIADALDLTLTQLMTCQKESPEDPEIQASSILEVAGESQRRQKRNMWLFTVGSWLLMLLIVVGVCLYIFAGTTGAACTKIVGKEIIGESRYVYMEEDGHLLTLRCSEQEIYDAIIANSNLYYDITYSWNRLTYRGELINCTASDAIGTPVDLEGSSIGVDSLLGVDCILKKCICVHTDLYGSGYLYTFTYYYQGDGKDYYPKEQQVETFLLQVKDCRNVVAEDYDADGIVELFVLTKYDEQPYQLYDLEGTQIVSRFVENIPKSVSDRLHMGY